MERLQEAKKDLYKKGYVHLAQVLPEASVADGRVLLDRLFADHCGIAAKYATRHASSLEQATAEIQEINHVLALVPKMKQTSLYAQCRALAGVLLGRRAYYSFDHAIYKPPKSGAVSWHQDQAYKSTVKKMQSIHMWVPLHDVPLRAGALQYVPYSHLQALKAHRRHKDTGTLFVDADVESNSPISKCAAKMGDIVVHLPNTLHSSLPNLSRQTRKAWILHFSPYGRFEMYLPHNILHGLRRRLMA
ncbi:phytanoyl-CoA dioxygenase family protein [Exilibacterium tricleocarpae]|uniref:Phytanoyl-CoA dioxygenase family protein n=1 Tax=Exilibacterium tricleocarpae TaxID=2591008 RepID=A0A545UBE8_9GAMM|nr:phytanoyl-CoA dioxygenase family protein [Exilibacterium tricleocarpae]TQV86785.1 phytanoyl-CoA dioxygenase family protein [Exilibacterium tricleocarpae]